MCYFHKTSYPRAPLNPDVSVKVHVYDGRAASAANLSCHSHFCSSTYVSAYLKFGDKPEVNERAMLEDRVKLGERSMGSDGATSVWEGDGPGGGPSCDDWPGNGESATLGETLELRVTACCAE